MDKKQCTLENLVMNRCFWQNKKILLTGHTGFKGSWLALWLQSLEAEVIGVSLAPPTQPNLFSIADVSTNMTSIIGDIRDFEFLKQIQAQHQPEIIFHCAAQSLVRQSYSNPIETYATNVMGTVNLLESIRQANSTAKAVIVVTSDKCYENREWLWPYRETDSLGGYDPYSNSKACTELVAAAFRNSYFHPAKSPVTGIATVRAGNVIGGGDWASERLIPDIIRSLDQHHEMIIRYPHALRPWQHVLEPLCGYLQLAEKLYYQPAQYAEAWNFGPEDANVKSVGWMVNKVREMWNLPISCQPAVNNTLHEAGYLKLDSNKAKARLSWQAHWNIEQALLETLKWYNAYRSGKNMREITLLQIKEFQEHLYRSAHLYINNEVTNEQYIQ